MQERLSKRSKGVRRDIGKETRFFAALRLASEDMGI